MNTKKLSDKVALVTGGTSGIGKTTAIEFARAGAKVVLSGRREKEGASVVAEIQLHPVGRIGTSEEIPAAVLYLCSDDAKFTTGTSLVVDGGMLAQ